MDVKKVGILSRVLLATSLFGAATFGIAQTAPPPPPPAPTPMMAPADAPVSRMDLFTGYSYLAPKGVIKGSAIVPDGFLKYGSVDLGAIGSFTYYFDRYVGLSAEYGGHQLGRNDNFQTAEGGVSLRYPTGQLVMFGHALVGGAKVGGPNYPGKPACTTKPCEPGTDIYVNCCTWGPGLTAGGGLDYIFPWFNSRIALRVFQADYEYIHVDFGNPPFVSSNVAGGRANISAAQVSSGLVWRFGVIAPPPPVTYACSVTPAVVFPGDTITITGTASNLNPKRTAAYSWTATSGPVTGTTATVTINTAQLAPGNYTVTGHVTEGNKAGEMADCTASYTVRAYEPPTVTCSANPSTVSPGQDSAITAMGMSPQNRPLTYSYSASAGTIDASTTTSTTLHTTGAASGSITVTCNVQDDKGQSASANTMVTAEAPAPPPAPKAEKLCSITFDRDKKRPTRVDNEAKACLDEVALSAQQHADAKIVVVGESAPGKMSDKMAKERAVNTKAYLVTEKGVDASRIDVRTGPEGSNQVENYMVPAGANMDADFPGTMAFDADSVKAQSRMAPAKHHRRGAEHAAPQHSGSENGMHAAPQGTAPAQQ